MSEPTQAESAIHYQVSSLICRFMRRWPRVITDNCASSHLLSRKAVLTSRTTDEFMAHGRETFSRYSRICPSRRSLTSELAWTSSSIVLAAVWFLAAIIVFSGSFMGSKA